jgi:transcriptional regulator with XRE-family HTH domain
MLGFEAKKIRELREQKDLTIEAFAAQIGTSKQAASAWETGATQPRVSTLINICNRFSVPLNFFIFDVHQSEQH